MSNKAAEKELNALHSLVAKVLMGELERDRSTELVDENGVTVKIEGEVPAQILAQARQFLKDNSITTDIETSDDLKAVQSILDKKKKLGSKVLSMHNASKAAGEE